MRTLCKNRSSWQRKIIAFILVFTIILGMCFPTTAIADSESKAETKVSLDVKELDESGKLCLTATVSDDAGIVLSAGGIGFYIDDEWKETVSLNGGQAILEIDLPDRTAKHLICARYDGDENYAASEAACVYGKLTPAENTDYTVSKPNSNGWYGGENPLVISPMGDFNEICETDASDDNRDAWTNSLTITPDADTAEGVVYFVLRNSESLEETNVMSYSYKFDHTAPTNISVDGFTDYEYEKQAYAISFFATDAESGVEKIIWYDGENNASEVMANDDGEFIAFLSVEQWKSMSRVEAVDYAGNKESKEIRLKCVEIEYDIADGTVDLTGITSQIITWESRNSESAFFHNTDFDVHFQISGYEAAANDVKITINNAVQDVAWKDDGAGGYICDITVDNLGENLISVSADGYIIVSNEYNGKSGNDSYNSGKHIIDKQEPVVRISDTILDDTTVVTVTVQEDYFDPSLFDFESFSVTDINGEHLTNENELKTRYLNALSNANWILTSEGYVAENAIQIESDGIYHFSLSCDDMAGNRGISPAQSFELDNTPPTNFVVDYKSVFINLLFNAITFGYYNSEITIVLSAEDAVSGMESFSWSYTGNDGSTESGLLDNLEYSSDGKTATASFVLTASEYKQYGGTLDFSAKDRSGNETDAAGDVIVHNSDGSSEKVNGEFEIIIDTAAPLRSVYYPEPQLIRDKTTLQTYLGDKAEYARQEETNSIFYYNSDADNPVVIDVVIQEANFYPEDVEVLVNGNSYAVSAWLQDKENTDMYTGQIKLTEEGEYQFVVKYKDRSGNEMAEYNSPVIVIDRTAPSVEKYTFEPLSCDGTAETGEFINGLEYGYYFNENFTLTVMASDALSGVDYVSYRLVSYQNGKVDNELTGELCVKDGKLDIEIPMGFKGQIFAEGYDNAGNKSEEVVVHGVVVENTAPDVTIRNTMSTAYKDANDNPLYDEDTSLVVTVSDDESGIQYVKYSQCSEKETFEKEIALKNTGYQIGDDVGDGWIVVSMEANLVTELRREFFYAEDNNDIVLSVVASDRAGNVTNVIDGTCFSVDKTAPVINVSFRDDDDTDLYYNADRIADITIAERNFDERLMEITIKNAVGSAPSVSFQKISDTEYAATVVFDEGDYTFEVNGMDLSGHKAVVNYTGGNERVFYVDKTAAVITENFGDFINAATENSFNVDKIVEITITEHNFDSALAGLQILRKEPGTTHNTENFVDVTDTLISDEKWADSGDTHTLTVTLSADSVYQIIVAPVDLAGNITDARSSAVFEIDRTIPVVAKRNGNDVEADETEFVDIYAFERKNDSVPTIEFSDTNIAYLKYTLRMWIPDYSDSESIPIIAPVNVYADEDQNKAGIVEGNKFILPEFSEDGIYSLEIIAVDKAGNESLLNVNTYARMVSQDVLAYIMDSNLERQSGLYSFQYEDGTPISMRPDKFQDLRIYVFASSDSAVDVVLRNSDAEEIYVDAQVTMDEDSIYGFTAYNFLVKSDFFTDRFSNDTDTELYLSVRNEEQRIDLGRIHIDGVAPTCVVPQELHSWYWYFGEEARTITLSEIDEPIDTEATKVYDNGQEIPFEYSSETQTLTITLEKGWHDVGFVLTDMAGNSEVIQEAVHIHIGYFWLWIIIAADIIATLSVVSLLTYRKIKRQNN